jgi:hypothetical protein
MNNNTKMTRRGLLAGVAAIAVAMTPAVATALGELPAETAADPIHSLIGQYRTLSNAAAATEDECDDALQDRWEIIKAIFTTAPTTIAGVAAWLQHIGGRDDSFGCSLVALVGHDTRFQEMMSGQFLAMSDALTRAQS